MICRGCGGSLASNQLVCSYCGLLNAADLDDIRDFKLLEEHSQLQCKNGCGHLQVLQLDCGLDVRVAHCKTCNGLFFAPGALNVLLDRVNALAQQNQVYRIPDLAFASSRKLPKAKRKNQPCPACSQAMRSVSMQRLEYERCAHHGDALDNGELAELVYHYHANLAAPGQHPKSELTVWQPNRSRSWKGRLLVFLLRAFYLILICIVIAAGMGVLALFIMPLILCFFGKQLWALTSNFPLVGRLSS